MSESLAFYMGSCSFSLSLSLICVHSHCPVLQQWLVWPVDQLSCYGSCCGCSSFFFLLLARHSMPFCAALFCSWKTSKNIALIFTTFICTVIEFHQHEVHVLLGLFCVLHFVWLNVLISHSCLWCEPCRCAFPCTSACLKVGMIMLARTNTRKRRIK